jgi:hypothetical protein
MSTFSFTLLLSFNAYFLAKATVIAKTISQLSGSSQPLLPNPFYSLMQELFSVTTLMTPLPDENNFSCIP